MFEPQKFLTFGQVREKEEGNMKKKTLESILSGEKKEIRVCGRTYRIQMNPEAGSVYLVPVGDGDVARGLWRQDEYEFTPGGKTFRRAVKIAQEVAAAMPQDTNT